MGAGKGLALLIGGIIATQVAAYELRAPHLGDLLFNNIPQALGDYNQIGAVARTLWDFFEEYGRNFGHDKFSTLGTFGQLAGYSGLLNMGYNAIRRPKKEDEPQKE